MFPGLIAPKRVSPIVPTWPVACPDRSMHRLVRRSAVPSRRSRDAHVLPLTGMGWTVVIVACGLLAALGAFALVMF